MGDGLGDGSTVVNMLYMGVAYSPIYDVAMTPFSIKRAPLLTSKCNVQKKILRSWALSTTTPSLTLHPRFHISCPWASLAAGTHVEGEEAHL
jgi:hypothetical protein